MKLSGGGVHTDILFPCAWMREGAEGRVAGRVGDIHIWEEGLKMLHIECT